MRATIEINKFEDKNTRSDITLLIESETELGRTLIVELEKQNACLRFLPPTGAIEISLDFDDAKEE